MGTITIEGMEFYAHHGYYDHEESTGNKFVVDLVLKADIAEAAATDDLQKTVNYERVYEIVKEQMEIRSKLLEHAAKRIFDTIKAQFPEITIDSLRIAKKNPPLKGMVDNVSVTIGE